jgi:hypothetical protein
VVGPLLEGEGFSGLPGRGGRGGGGLVEGPGECVEGELVFVFD